MRKYKETGSRPSSQSIKLGGFTGSSCRTCLHSQVARAEARGGHGTGLLEKI
ncbi:hypothetical protein LguiA_029439 [Lonicera macranthoides]